MKKLFLTSVAALFLATGTANAQESTDVSKTQWSCAGTTLHVTRWSYDTAGYGEDSGGADYIIRFEGPPPRRLRIRENGEANGITDAWANGKPCKERK